MRLLQPDPADTIDPIAAYADLPPAAGRPDVRLNMVASLDGAIAVDGVSSGLGGTPITRGLWPWARSARSTDGRPSSPTPQARPLVVT